MEGCCFHICSILVVDLYAYLMSGVLQYKQKLHSAFVEFIMECWPLKVVWPMALGQSL